MTTRLEVLISLRSRLGVDFDDQVAVARLILPICERLLKENPEVSKPADRFGPVTWYAYEHEIWAFGESLRHLLSEKKRWRGECEVLSAVASVAADTRFGKGRESFVMLLGYFGRHAYAPLIESLLSDGEVSDHAIYAARRAKIPGLEAKIRPLVNSKNTRTRNDARQYMAAVEQWKERK